MSRNNEATDVNVRAGARVYNAPFLTQYDRFVLGFVCRWGWRCSADHMVDHYNRNISNNHLDIGPGTGYFLDNCTFPSDTPTVSLLDLSASSLEASAHRIARYNPTCFSGDVFEVNDFAGKRFDSVGMNMFLHCLPGSMQHKTTVFDSLAPSLNDGARVFGSTVLGRGDHHTRISNAWLTVLNRNRTFSNYEDTHEGLRKELEARFADVRVEQVGAFSLFSGVYLRPA